MKLTISLTILLILVLGCKPVNNLPPVEKNSSSSISGIQELVLNPQDLGQLGMKSDQLKQLGMTTNGTDCQIESYQADEFSPQQQNGICSYIIPGLNNSEVVIQLNKFTNLNDLNGSYQYESLHLYSSEGLISENDYGDRSRFRVNNEHDYGGEFNDPNIYYYHLWFTKDKYLIHITSKGSEGAKDYISKIGNKILSKFE